MIVWAGCKACKDQNVLTGRWVEESELPHLDPIAEHQLQAYDVVVTGKHAEPLVAYPLEAWGIPPEMPEWEIRVTAEVMDTLAEAGIEYPAWLLAAWMLDKEPYELTPGAFKALYAGTYQGKPTRALRKRYSLTRTDPDHYYMWRRA